MSKHDRVYVCGAKSVSGEKCDRQNGHPGTHSYGLYASDRDPAQSQPAETRVSDAISVEVLFVRSQVRSDSIVTVDLAALYMEGWRVVSHAEAHGEYTFVLERVKRS